MPNSYVSLFTVCTINPSFFKCVALYPLGTVTVYDMGGLSDKSCRYKAVS